MQITPEGLIINELMREAFYKGCPLPFRAEIRKAFNGRIKAIQTEWAKVNSRDTVSKMRQEFVEFAKHAVKAVNEYKPLTKKVAYDDDELQRKCGYLANNAYHIQNEFAEHFELTENPTEEEQRGAVMALKMVYDRVRRLTITGMTEEYYWSNHNAEHENLIAIEPIDTERYFSCREYQSEILSVCLKALTPEWWFRRYRKAYKRLSEEFAIAAGMVGAKQRYCTDHALNVTKLSDARNQLFLAGVEIEREDGFRVSLDEVVKHSLANPANRHAQLMARIAGLEKLGSHENLNATFYTVTAPSRFHKNSPKYDGSTPNETRQFLQKTWEKLRAKLNRLGVYHFGVRVAEAHKDACPHWHLMLWCKPGEQNAMDSVFKEYALQADQDELIFDGALFFAPDAKANETGVVFRTPRLEIKRMLPHLGHPTGYIIKYISKNIKAHNESKAPEEVTTYADRVNAWARTHRIRQFQFIGDQTITAWNEARRISPEIISKFSLKLTKKTAEFVDACRGNDWFKYVQMMRENRVKVEKKVYRDEESQFFSKVTEIIGITVEHKNPIRAAYERILEMAESGIKAINPVMVDFAKARIKMGVATEFIAPESFKTRFYKWTKKPPGRAESEPPQAVRKAWSPYTNCTGGI